MGFLKRLFGGEKKESGYVDKRGIYFYVRCARCGTIVRVRADKEYDLQREGGGYVWHKTIVDNRCFRQMPTTVYLDGSYNVASAEIEGGEYVTEAEYNAWLAAQNAPDEEEE